MSCGPVGEISRRLEDHRYWPVRTNDGQLIVVLPSYILVIVSPGVPVPFMDGCGSFVGFLQADRPFVMPLITRLGGTMGVPNGMITDMGVDEVPVAAVAAHVNRRERMRAAFEGPAPRSSTCRSPLPLPCRSGQCRRDVDIGPRGGCAGDHRLRAARRAAAGCAAYRRNDRLEGEIVAISLIPCITEKSTEPETCEIAKNSMAPAKYRKEVYTRHAGFMRESAILIVEHVVTGDGKNPNYMDISPCPATIHRTVFQSWETTKNPP